MSRTVRALAVLVVVMVLLAGPVAGASPSRPTGTPSLWDSAWAWVMELLLPEDDSDGAIDPNGGGPQTTGTDDDAGKGIDPNG